MKMFYSIGEVAEMLDVPTSTVRFWESKFDVLKPAKDGKGNRRFTPQDIENLKLIYHLVREKGLTIDGARKRLKNDHAELARDQEIMDRLLGVRAILQEIREELREGGGEVVYEGGAAFDGEAFPASGATDSDTIAPMQGRASEECAQPDERECDLDRGQSQLFSVERAQPDGNDRNHTQIQSDIFAGEHAPGDERAGDIRDLSADDLPSLFESDYILQMSNELSADNHAPVDRPSIVEQTLF